MELKNNEKSKGGSSTAEGPRIAYELRAGAASALAPVDGNNADEVQSTG